MSTQQYLARGITEGRAFARQDPAVLRDVELARAGQARSWLPFRRGNREA